MHPSIEQHRTALQSRTSAGNMASRAWRCSDRLPPTYSILSAPTSTSSFRTHRTTTSVHGWRFQELEGALANLLGRNVDLVMTSALKNRWFAREAAKRRTVIYDASTVSEVA